MLRFPFYPPVENTKDIAHFVPYGSRKIEASLFGNVFTEDEVVVTHPYYQFLGPEDRAVFDDLLIQCKLYAPQAGVLASPVKEVPLLLSMIFAQHKRLAELEKRLKVAFE